MNYEYIVEKITKVIGLTEVPVYFNGNNYGVLAFDIGAHVKDINPNISDLNLEMFDFLKSIKNEHLKYFHVEIPEVIYCNDYHYEVFKDLFNSKNINVKIDKNLIEIYCILHEFGHAHQLYVQYNKNLEKFISEVYVESVNGNKKIIELGLCNTKEGLLAHKKLLAEQYADNFALNNFEKVLEII